MEPYKALFKITITILISGLAGQLNAYAQDSCQSNRWGKNAYISQTSSTLDGVKPIANWIWDSGPENPRNYYLLVRKTFNIDRIPLDAITYISAFAYADVYI